MEIVKLSKFSERLVEKMVERNIKQVALAQVLGTTQQSVSNWVKGIHEPDYSTLMFICHYLLEDPNYMLGFDEVTEQAMQEFQSSKIAKAL